MFSNCNVPPSLLLLTSRTRFPCHRQVNQPIAAQVLAQHGGAAAESRLPFLKSLDLPQLLLSYKLAADLALTESNASVAK